MGFYYRRKSRALLFFVLFPSIILLLVILFFARVSPLFLKLSEDKIYSVTFSLVNKTILCELSKLESNQLIEYTYSDSGNIIAVNPNIIEMNKLSTSISQTVSDGLASLDKIYVQLPLGSFVSNNFFAGTGPRIPVQIMLLNKVSVVYNTDFYSTGINQTCHKILMTINCDIRLFSKLAKKDLNVKIELPIAETIIIGNVPSTYLELPK